MDALLPQPDREPDTDKPRQVRQSYAKRMNPKQLSRLKAELSEEDRYDLMTEQAMYRDYIATMVDMEARVMEKHPDRPELLLAIQAQKMEAINEMAKMFETTRRIENAGTVFTNEKVGGLIDKIASLVVYHVTNEAERQRVLSDMNEIAAAFRRADTEGTLLTPDQDALMMDGTVPSGPDFGDDTNFGENLCIN